MKKFENGLLAYNLQFFADGEGETSEGATEQESADLAGNEGVETESETTEGVTEAAAEPQPQSPEVNAAFADMRRRMEAAERKAAQIDAMYAKQFGGYNNPETGQPIRSAQDYMNAMAAQERLQARQKLQENNIDPSIIDNLIANSPVVRQAEAQMAELTNMRAQQEVERDIAEVLKLDPTLTSKDAIMNDPSFPQVLEKVQSGMRLVDAYKLVNFDRLSSSKTAAARQAVVNQVKGQAHLSNAPGILANDTLEDIPASMLEDFKDLFPGKSTKELKALYNKTLQSRR